MFRNLFITAAVAAAAQCLTSAARSAEDPLGKYPPGYTATGPNGYVYVAPSTAPAMPAYPYPYGTSYGGFGAGYYGRAYWPPPVSFGSPFYNGYNDPNYALYGPGVREFLQYGGADFYGW